VPPEGSLPKCQTTYRKNPGDGKIDETRLSNYKSRYGDKLDLIPVSPEDGDCGTIKTVIADVAESCCGFVIPLIWDEENSAEVIADNDRGTIMFSGGRRPVTVSVRGTGFYLDSSGTLRDGTVSGNSVTIWTKDACGVCLVTITDGCSSINVTVQSTNGNWEYIGAIQYNAATVRQRHNLDYCGSYPIGGDDGPVIFQRSGPYVASNQQFNPMIGTDAVYKSNFKENCDQEERDAEDFLDHVVRLFTLKGLPGVNGGPPYSDHNQRRIWWYYPGSVYGSVKIHKWRC